MNMNNQTLKSASPHTLKMLLLACAGALLIIALVLTNVIYDAQPSLLMHGVAQPAGAQPITPRGPEADPSLRHAPGGYDYELEPPPEEMP